MTDRIVMGVAALMLAMLSPAWAQDEGMGGGAISHGAANGAGQGPGGGRAKTRENIGAACIAVAPDGADGNVTGYMLHNVCDGDVSLVYCLVTGGGDGTVRCPDRKLVVLRKDESAPSVKFVEDESKNKINFAFAACRAPFAPKSLQYEDGSFSFYCR